MFTVFHKYFNWIGVNIQFYFRMKKKLKICSNRIIRLSNEKNEHTIIFNILLTK